MCGGFTCSKVSLQLLNVLYLLVGVLLIGIAAYAKAAAVITSFQIAGGIIASGLFLLIIAFLGLFAAIKHHQVILFFYVVILFLLFIIQFSVSIACLAITEDQVNDSIENAWKSADSEVGKSLVENAESNFHCCGWDRESIIVNTSVINQTQGYRQSYLSCVLVNCPSSSVTTTSSPSAASDNGCALCSSVIPEMTSSVLEATGGIGLFFSFTEMLGVWLAVRFRNQKDPKANPSQFL